MDERTGEMGNYGDLTKGLKPEEKKFIHLIPQRFVEQMQGMNRHERRKFYRLHRDEFNEEV